MIRGSHITLIATLLLEPLSAAAEVPVILTIEVANSNFYIRDETDYAKLATTASIVNRAPSANFDQGITMADIISVNGVPAKGILFGRWDFIRSSPTPQSWSASGRCCTEWNRRVVLRNSSSRRNARR